MIEARIDHPGPLSEEQHRIAFSGSFREASEALLPIFKEVGPAEEKLVELLALTAAQTLTGSVERTIEWARDCSLDFRYKGNYKQRNGREESMGEAYWHARLLARARSDPSRLASLALVIGEALEREIGFEHMGRKIRATEYLGRQGPLMRILLGCADLLSIDAMQGSSWPHDAGGTHQEDRRNELAAALESAIMLAASPGGDAMLAMKITGSWLERNPDLLADMRSAILPEAKRTFLAKAVELDLLAGGTSAKHTGTWLNSAPNELLPKAAETVEMTSKIKAADLQLLPLQLRGSRKPSKEIQRVLLLRQHPLCQMLGIRLEEEDMPAINQATTTTKTWEATLKAVRWCGQGAIKEGKGSTDEEGMVLRLLQLRSAGPPALARLMLELASGTLPIQWRDFGADLEPGAGAVPTNKERMLEQMKLITSICQALQARASDTEIQGSRGGNDFLDETFVQGRERRIQRMIEEPIWLEAMALAAVADGARRLGEQMLESHALDREIILQHMELELERQQLEKLISGSSAEHKDYSAKQLQIALANTKR